MITKSKKVHIFHKEIASRFHVKNSEFFMDKKRKIGASGNKLGITYEEEAEFLPTIIGRSLNAQDWQQKRDNYVQSIGVTIPAQGRELEVGFMFAMEWVKPEARKEYKPTSEEDLVKYVYGYNPETSLPNVPEDKKYLWGRPLNITDYLLWRYCLVYRDVANNIEDANKSAHIRFYLYDEDLLKKDKEDAHQLKNKAYGVYLDIIKDSILMDNVMYILRMDVAGKTLIEKGVMLEEYMSKNPAEFIRVCEDKKLNDKAFIEILIAHDILKRQPNTQLIEDLDENCIGTNIDEAISYMKQAINKSSLTKWEAMLKSKKVVYKESKNKKESAE